MPIAPYSNAQQLAAALSNMVGADALPSLGGVAGAAPAGVRAGGAARSHATPSTDVVQLGPQLATGLVPQGQGYDKANKAMVTSFYQGPLAPGGAVKKPGTFLSVQGVDPGKRPVEARGKARLVQLGGVHGGKPPQHAGGVTCSDDGKHYYVSDTHGVYVYDAKKARAGVSPLPASQFVPVAHGPVKGPNGKTLDASGSFMTVKGEWAYVGSYTKSPDGGALYRYHVNKDTGALEGKAKGPIMCPTRSQGMTVVNGGFLFTTGGGELKFMKARDFDKVPGGQGITVGHLRAYPQGLNVVGNDLLVTYESGARKYKGEGGTQAIQAIPLSALDYAGTNQTAAQWAAEPRSP